MLSPIGGLCRNVFDVFFPPICSICGLALDTQDDTICLACRSSFEIVGPVVCPVCGAPAERGGAVRCKKCSRRLLHFDSARAAFFYRDRFAEAIQVFKYNQRFELGRALGRSMFAILERDHPEMPPLDLLVPVPMHYLRRLRRGYNHSAILAEEYGRLKGLPTLPGGLVRIRNTPRQALLPPEKRASNVLGAFEAPHPEYFRGRRVGLVDDVLTSGHTVNECARILVAAGAAAVHVVALARA